jgi:ferredoxin
MADDTCRVDTGLCAGCGLCVTACPTEALSLALKEEADIAPPAFSEEDWRKERAEARIHATTK